MTVININVTNKVATAQGFPVIVCDNTDYAVKFTFDAEWDGHNTKTARFIYTMGGVDWFKDVNLTGDTCAVPAVSNIYELKVGVYSGDLSTSTPAYIPCRPSIRSGEASEDTAHSHLNKAVLDKFSEILTQEQADEYSETLPDGGFVKVGDLLYGKKMIPTGCVVRDFRIITQGGKTWLEIEYSDNMISAAIINIPIHRNQLIGDRDYYTDTEMDELLSGKADASHTHDERYYTETETDALLDGKAASDHNHDERYYTEVEVDAALSGKANVSHTHSDLYYTQIQTDTLLSAKKNNPSLITTGSNITLADNTEYKLTGVTELDLTYPSGDFESFLCVTFADSGTITVSFPSGTKYIGAAPDFANGETWEISIKNGIAVCGKAE